MSHFKNIVVADHRGKLDQFVCEVLGQDRWAVNHVDNLIDLEELMRSHRQHLVILNADLPRLKIRKFVHKLNKMFGAERPRILLCVHDNFSRMLREGAKAGVDDYLTVPFHGSELQAKTLKLLQFFNARDELQAEIQRLQEVLKEEQSAASRLVETVSQEKKVPSEEDTIPEAVAPLEGEKEVLAEKEVEPPQEDSPPGVASEAKGGSAKETRIRRSRFICVIRRTSV